MIKEIKTVRYTPEELNSNIAYGMTAVNSITQEELDSVQWLCEKSMNDDIYIAKLEEKLEAQTNLRRIMSEESQMNHLRYIETLVENERLKKQLTEKETRIAELEDKDWYESTIKQLEDQNARLIKERDAAKVELAEKDEKIKRTKLMLNCRFGKFGRTMDEINFAVEKLEKAKREMDKLVGYCEFEVWRIFDKLISETKGE